MAGYGTEFVFGDVQPVAMFECVSEFAAANQCAGLCGFTCFVKRSFGVRVEVITNQDDLYRNPRRNLPDGRPPLMPSLSLFDAFGRSPDASPIEVR